MTELRRRMDDDMLARGVANRTRESYLDAVTRLARFYHRARDRISVEEIQAYLVHLLRERQLSWSTCNIVLNGLRFFYHTTLKRHRTTFTIPSPRHSSKLPVVLSRDEVHRLIGQASPLRTRTMLLTTYAAGLRLTELLHLRVHDVDSARMTIRVVQGKGGKDRYTVLSPRLLEALRAYTTGASNVRAGGYFRRVARQTVRWSRPGCRRRITAPNTEPASPNRAAFTPCAIASRPIYWNRASTSTRSSDCWGMAI